MHAGYLQWKKKIKRDRREFCPTFLTGRWLRASPSLTVASLFVRFFPSVLHFLWSVREDNAPGIAYGRDFDVLIKPLSVTAPI